MKYIKIAALVSLFLILGIASAMAFDQNFREMVKQSVGLTPAGQSVVVNAPASSLSENPVAQDQATSQLPKEEVSVPNAKAEETCVPKSPEFVGGGNMSFLANSVNIVSVPAVIDTPVSPASTKVNILHLQLHPRTGCEILNGITVHHAGTGSISDISALYITDGLANTLSQRTSFTNGQFATFKFNKPLILNATTPNDLFIVADIAQNVSSGFHQFIIQSDNDGVSSFDFVKPGKVEPDSPEITSQVFTIKTPVYDFYKIQLFGPSGVQVNEAHPIRKYLAEILNLTGLGNSIEPWDPVLSLIGTVEFDSRNFEANNMLNNTYFININQKAGFIDTQKTYTRDNISASISKVDSSLLPYLFDRQYCKVDSDCIVGGIGMCDSGGSNTYGPWYDFAECHQTTYHQEDEKELQKMCTEKQYAEVSYNGVKCISNKCVAQNRQVACKNWE